MKITQEQIETILEMTNDQLTETVKAIGDIRKATDLYAECLVTEMRRRKIEIDVDAYN